MEFSGSDTKTTDTSRCPARPAPAAPSSPHGTSVMDIESDAIDDEVDVGGDPLHAEVQKRDVQGRAETSEEILDGGAIAETPESWEERQARRARKRLKNEEARRQ
ncbi:unnamed protein product [Pylaiella littoralis]